MCINLANEHLQHFFNEHVFHLEQEEYKKEGIDASAITYVDNTPLLVRLYQKLSFAFNISSRSYYRQTLFSRRKMGVLVLLDEESFFPRGTDESLVTKFNTNFATEVHYVANKHGKAEFGIKHYAGVVNYIATGFLEKNRDSLVIILRQSWP
jgi:myosin heavy subunit